MTTPASIPVAIGPDSIDLRVDGEIHTGGPEIILAGDDDLTQHLPWGKQGFTIAPFLSKEDHAKLRDGVRDILRKVAVEELGRDLGEFALNLYHTLVTDEEHFKIMERTRRCLPKSWMPIPPEMVEQHVSKILGIEATLDSGHPDNLYDFCFRVVRPMKFTDNNPPHRDVYLDNIRNCVNIYAPLCGSNERSSLPIVPGSHLLQESAIERTHGITYVNGIKFTVPCITALNGNRIRMDRPNPSEGEVMVFSPYLVHGGGYNFNSDYTRVSLEMRFWRKRG